MRKIADPESHFWTRVNIASGSLCWEWAGPINEWGYGIAKLSHLKTQIASRVAWILTNGTVPPKGVLVCHKCDNPKCCRPDHLFLGTSADNAMDRDRKGRTGGTPGEKHWAAKITDADIPNIRKMRSNGMILKDIANKYGVTIASIGYITTGKTWTHVKGGSIAFG